MHIEIINPQQIIMQIKNPHCDRQPRHTIRKQIKMEHDRKTPNDDRLNDAMATTIASKK